MESLETVPPAGTPKFVSDLDTLIRARYPLIYLVSWEEQRLDAVARGKQGAGSEHRDTLSRGTARIKMEQNGTLSKC